jgi:hypothetical protein
MMTMCSKEPLGMEILELGWDDTTGFGSGLRFGGLTGLRLEGLTGLRFDGLTGLPFDSLTALRFAELR